MTTSESRLVITVDSRSAEQRAKDTARALGELEKHGLGAQAGVDEVNKALKNTEGAAGAAQASVKRLVAGALAGLSAMKVVDTADEWGQLAARMKMATQSADEYERAQARMLQSANNTYRSISETRESFIQLSPVLRQMGMSLEQSMDAIDAFSGLLVVNAASGDRAQAAMRALSISMQKGKIDADNWITIYSTLDSVVDVIAAQTGMAAEEIRKLGAEGKLSIETFAKSLVGQVGNINSQVESMPTTVRDAMQKVGNEFTEYIGRANEARGVTAGLADGIAFLGENLTGALNTAVVAGGAALAAYTARQIGAAAAVGASIIASREAALAAVAKTRAELAEAQAQSVQTAATLAQAKAMQGLTATRAQLVAATAAHEAAEKRVVAAQAASTAANAASVGLGARLLGVLGGPVGLVATIGLTAAGFYAMNGASKRASLSLDDMTGSADKAVAKFKELGRLQRELALTEVAKAQAAAVRETTAALSAFVAGIEPVTSQGGRAVAQMRASMTAQVKQLVADTSLSAAQMEEGLADLIDTWVQMGWISEDNASKIRASAPAMTTAAGTANQLGQNLREMGAAAQAAAGGVAVLNDTLVKTDEAGKKYLENLTDRSLIAGLTTQRAQLEALVKAGKLVYAPEDLERARTAADRIDAAAKATKGLKTSMTEAARAAKQLTEWLAEQNIATASTDAMTAAYVKGGAAISELTRLQRIEEQVLKSGEKARKAITEAVNAQGKAADRLDVAKRLDELRRQNAAGTAYIEVLKAQSQGLEIGRAAMEAYNAEQALSALLLGKNSDEVADLTEKFRLLWDQSAGIERQTQAQRDLNQIVDSTRTKQERYNAEMARLQGLKGFATTAEQVEGLSRAMKQLERENSVWFEFTEKALERIDGAFADMWKGVIDGSENVFDVISGGFKQMLAEMAHAAITRPIMISVGNSIMGTSNPGGWSDVWGGGGGSTLSQGMNVASSIQTAWSALSGGLTSTLASGVSSIGSAIGSSALTSFAAGMKGSTLAAGLAGPTTAGAGGAMGLGSMAATALPWVAGAAAVYGLISAFSNAPETRTGAQYGLAMDGQLYNPRRGTTVASANGVQFLEGPSGGGDSPAVQQAIQGTVDGINGLFKTIGADISLAAFWAGFEGSEKGRGGVGAGGMLSTGFAFGEQGTGDNYRGTLFDPSRPGSLSPEEALNMLPAQLAQASLQAWQSAAEMMPPALARILQGADLAGMGDDALIALRDQFVAAVAEAEMLRMGLAALPWVPATAQTYAFATALADAAGGAENAANLLTGYYQTYYTEAERMADLTGSLTSRFADLGLALPTTLSELRAQVDANLALGEAGAGTVASLLALAPELATLIGYTDTLAESERQLSATRDKQALDLQGQIAELRADLYGDADGLAAHQNALRQQQLDALDPLNRAQQEYVWGLQAEKDARDALNAKTTEMKGLRATFDDLVDPAGKLTRQQQDLADGFAAVGQIMPTTLQGYADLVNGMRDLGEAHADDYEALLRLAPAFGVYIEGINGVADATKASAKAFADAQQSARDSIAQSVGSLQERIVLDSLGNDQARYGYWDAQFRSYSALAETLTDPAAIAEATSKAVSAAGNAYGLLDEAGRASSNDRYLKTLADLQERSFAAVDKAQEKTTEKQAQAIRDAIKPLIDDAVRTVQTAARSAEDGARATVRTLESMSTSLSYDLSLLARRRGQEVTS